MKQRRHLSFITIASLLSVLSLPTAAQVKLPVIRSNVNKLNLTVDNFTQIGAWHVVPGSGIDEFKTTGHTVTFASDIDTFRVQLDEWQTADFGILTSSGDTARVRITREPTNPFENPDPLLKKIAPSGLLSRKQAAFDIDALIYALNEVHPDIYSNCKQADLMRAVNEAKASLPDSVSKLEMFRRLAPIVSMIGDGHTRLFFPFNDIFTKDMKRIPLFFNVGAKNILTCGNCVDSIIPKDSRILSINGHTAEEMLTACLPYISGEREHFKVSQLGHLFLAYFHMLYSADTYTVCYKQKESGKKQETTFPAMLWNDFVPRMQTRKKQKNSDTQPYSFSIDRKKGVAILDFKEFRNANEMKTFTDSLFRTLREENIKNLIIDIRQNGGGNSAVGDVLLRYIAPKPFVQMEKALVKKTPLTIKLIGNKDMKPGVTFFEHSPEEYIRPLSERQNHFQGHVYLLTSNYTFSSAASFAWTFKTVGAGQVIGEETGGMNVSYGDYLNYRLPVSRLTCGISYKRFWQFHANENDIHGTIPDISVPADEALTTALKQIKRN